MGPREGFTFFCVFETGSDGDWLGAVGDDPLEEEKAKGQ